MRPLLEAMSHCVSIPRGLPHFPLNVQQEAQTCVIVPMEWIYGLTWVEHVLGELSEIEEVVSLLNRVVVTLPPRTLFAELDRASFAAGVACPVAGGDVPASTACDGNPVDVAPAVACEGEGGNVTGNSHAGEADKTESKGKAK